MISLLMLPSLEAKFTQLRDLCEQHPDSLPLPTVAKFLDVDAEGLRASIEHGRCPFGISWQKDVRGYRAFKIPTIPFYLWFTQGAGYKQGVDKG